MDSNKLQVSNEVSYFWVDTVETVQIVDSSSPSQAWRIVVDDSPYWTFYNHHEHALVAIQPLGPSKTVPNHPKIVILEPKSIFSKSSPKVI